MLDQDGKPSGQAHSNPLLDTREYEVDFPDGTTNTYTANLIAQNIYSQVDQEGRSYAILNEIVDHRKDGRAISADDGYFTCQNGRKLPKRTTVGWDLQVEWRDGSTTWIPLKDLKESNPVEVGEYGVANKIVSEPAFKWWVKDVLRKRDRIISKVKSRKYWKKSHKFGLELPKSVKEAYEIDRNTNTDFWTKAIIKEMLNMSMAFKFLKDGEDVPAFYKQIDCHMVFDIKMSLD